MLYFIFVMYWYIKSFDKFYGKDMYLMLLNIVFFVLFIVVSVDDYLCD